MAIVLGLTGGIASGKSTVSDMLRELGYTVIDADVEARLAVKKGEPAYEKIINTFGEEILLEDGEIDRQRLGSIIFHDKEKRQALNNIVHPAVRRNMTSKKEEAISKGAEVVVLDIPLLFESKLTYMVEKTLLVYVDDEVQLQRLMKRNDLVESEALARIQSQMPLSEKIALADAVIDNNGDLNHTRKQLLTILDEWRR